MGCIWKEIEGYEGKYSVSNTGLVKNNINGKEVVQVLTGIPQYKYVNLRGKVERKLVRVHRLVALAFIPEVEGCPIVDHIDRDKLNNHVSNLRWVDKSGNQRNTSTSFYTEHDGESKLLIELCESIFGEAYPHYTYLKACVDRGLSFEDSLLRYEEFKRVGNKTIKVEYQGKEHYLLELCDKHNKDYESVKSRLDKGWDVWESLFNCPPSTTGIQIRQEDGSCLWFKTAVKFYSESGRSPEVCGKALVGDWTWQYLLTYQPDLKKDYVINGITKKRDEWIRYYETTETRVNTNILRKGISFEEAVQLPVERVKNVKLNGTKMMVADMWKMFGLHPKTCNTVRSKLKISFKQALEHFGVDTSDLEIEVV
ncbi:NUMOD4 motif protein [compost metagenome]